MSFKNISAQEVTQTPQRLVLNQILLRGPDGKSASPELHVVHLGEGNGEFWSDALAKAGATASAGGKRGKLTPQQVREARGENRATVAKYAVRGVKGFFHDDGREATIADVAEIVDALPDTVFDSVLAFVMNAENFRERPTATDDQVAVVAGK